MMHRNLEVAMLPHEIPLDCIIDLEALDRFLLSERSPPDNMMLSENSCCRANGCP